MVRPGCGGGRNLGDSGRGAVRPTWTRDRPHAFPFRAVLTVRLAFASRARITRARIAPPNTERERTDRTNERTGERFCNVIETKRAQFYQLARLVAHTRKPSPASWTPGRLPTGRVAGPSPSGSLSPPSWLAERFGVDGDDPRDAPRVQPRADHPGRRPGNRLERERHAGGRIRPPPPRHGPRMDGRDPGLRDPVDRGRTGARRVCRSPVPQERGVCARVHRAALRATEGPRHGRLGRSASSRGTVESGLAGPRAGRSSPERPIGRDPTRAGTGRRAVRGAPRVSGRSGRFGTGAEARRSVPPVPHGPVGLGERGVSDGEGSVVARAAPIPSSGSDRGVCYGGLPGISVVELVGAQAAVEIPRNDTGVGVPHPRRGGVDSVWDREIGSRLDDPAHGRTIGAARRSRSDALPTCLSRKSSESQAQDSVSPLASSFRAISNSHVPAPIAMHFVSTQVISPPRIVEKTPAK